MADEYAGGEVDRTSTTKGMTHAQVFQSRESKKLSLVRRCEEYAQWTLPHVFPFSGMKDTEMQGPVDSTGARAVNHLSNKLIMTLFQPYSPFFRLQISSDVAKELEAAAQAGDKDAQGVLDNLDKLLADAEKDAMRTLDYNKYRTEATNAAKALIITGNALMYHPEVGRVQSYGLRDYCVQRDLSGTVIEIITRDKKAFGTFAQPVKDALRASRNKKYDKDSCDVTLYTYIEMKDDGKYHMSQSADDVPLDSKAVWTVEELPYITLAWNLVRGEDYGRGLVEDYAGAFHALFVLNNALVDMIGIASDVKFLVDPASVIDVKEMNDSESGTYHSGKEGDVTTVKFDKVMDIQAVEAAIVRFQQQIGQAFLLNSAVTRDAERVTAEEIRYVAQELELSHGGIYSRFAEEWQLRTAVLMLRKVDIKIGAGSEIYPQIITGLDSLSRAGDLDNLRMFVADLQLLQSVPDEMRAVIDPARFAAFIGTRRGVDYEKFLKTPTQIQQEQAAMAQAQQAQVATEAVGAVATEAGKAALQEQ